MLDPVIKEMGEPLLVLRADGSDPSAEPGSANVDWLDGTGEGVAVIELDDQLKGIADLHEHPAFNSHTGFTDIQHLARRRERSALDASDPANLYARLFSFESHGAFKRAL